MKKTFVVMTALAVLLFNSAAHAEHHEKEGKDGPPHKGHWEKVDTNADGQISKGEFLAKQEERFKKIDTNSDGVLSKEEIKAGHKGMIEKMKEKRENHKERKDRKVNDVPEPAAEE